MSKQTARSEALSRREFLKTTAAATVGFSALMAGGNFAYAGGRDVLRVGLVGCGGRGTGAARDSLTAADGVELVAIGDLFADRVAECRQKLATVAKETPELTSRIKVTDDTAFVGWDAYRRVIDSGVDLVILATPPAFRPEHMAYAVDRGKHLFVEKPIAVDPVGVRSVIATSELAKQKGLAVVAGTQRRHQFEYVETIRRIHDGAIGEVLSGQVYWNQGGLWNKPRQPEWTDMEFQLRNWLYFTWLSGDHIVEQHVHNIDVANWVIGAHPVKAIATGGRQVRTDPAYGHIFDHFAVDFEYPSGARVLSMCRQQDGTSPKVDEHFIGSNGFSDARSWIRGQNAFRYDGEKPNPYVQEHRDLVASIRAGKPLNEGRQVAESVLSAILGREAAYTGKELTWDEVLNSNLKLGPEKYEFGPLPTPPVAVPGVTTLDRAPWTASR